ncbi:uncharacterized protein LOC126412931 [Schistocerca serialis cubense]|uniref:uncharacterized protein LOC126412931 n=1 Tax=Schistocerca serialis cubense TaxID=2023355 RepID=UPI00214E0E69|nr:uncharacterized protein LOC126412931 [Schistocerca serialis cubense]
MVLPDDDTVHQQQKEMASTQPLGQEVVTTQDDSPPFLTHENSDIQLSFDKVDRTGGALWKVKDVCDIEGLLCHHMTEKLHRLKPKSSNDTNAIYCQCPSGCEEIQIDETYNSEVLRKDLGDIAILDISLERSSSLRYRRVVVRGSLDMVVMPRHEKKTCYDGWEM